MRAKEDMRVEQVGMKTEQDAFRTVVMVETERLASKKDMEFWRGEGQFSGGKVGGGMGCARKMTYLEEETERHAGDEGLIIDHGAEEGGTTRLSVVGAKARVKSPRKCCGGG